MADVLTLRDMEDFLLNPTSKMNDRHLESSTSTLHPQSSGRPVPADEDKTRSPRESFSDPLAEHLYCGGYTSDEEDLSSADGDAMSIMSTSSGEILDMVPTRLSIVSADDLARSCSAIEKPFFRAQMVTLKPINHGDVALSPKLVDIPPSPRLQRPSSYFKPPTSRLQKLDTAQATRRQRSVTTSSTPRTSSDHSSNASTPSTPPTSVDERSPVSSNDTKILRRKSAVAGMRGAAAPPKRDLSHPMPDSQTLREFLASSPSTSTPIPTTPAHLATPGRSKLRKFSSSFSLGRFSPISTSSNSSPFSKRKDSLPDTPTSSADESLTLPVRPAARTNRQTLPAQPATYIPTRGSSLRPPPSPLTAPSSSKMVPRGANERAPPIVLPPCPDDSDEDIGTTGRRALHPRSYAPTGAPGVGVGKRLHRRQRSVSADDVMLL